jgi:hypothetical protein
MSIVILVLRMAQHNLPPANIGIELARARPDRDGALGLLVLGVAAPAILAKNGLGAYASAIEGVGLVGAVMLWEYGARRFALDLPGRGLGDHASAAQGPDHGVALLGLEFDHGT